MPRSQVSQPSLDREVPAWPLPQVDLQCGSLPINRWATAKLDTGLVEAPQGLERLCMSRSKPGTHVRQMQPGRPSAQSQASSVGSSALGRPFTLTVPMVVALTDFTGTLKLCFLGIGWAQEQPREQGGCSSSRFLMPNLSGVPAAPCSQVTVVPATPSGH